MRVSVLAGAALAAAVGVRVVTARHKRFMHPDGRSFDGELEIRGAEPRTGALLLDEPGKHPVIVRISKGVGTRRGLPDVMGLAVRVRGAHPVDLLLSSCGRNRVTRHVPVPRRTFDTMYGSIVGYRAGDGRKIYLSATGEGLGSTLESVAAAGNGAVTLEVDGRPVGRIVLGEQLTDAEDATLAFDPIRDTTADLHPTGLIHRARAYAYPLSQRWRGVR